MWRFLTGLFSNNFMPHRTCYMNDAGVLWLNVISDVGIALAYYLIPLLLFYFVRRRRDVEFRWIFGAFGTFVVACGTTHVLGAVTVWDPVYRLEGVVKAVTAVSSIVTLAMLGRMMPELLTLPTHGSLKEINRLLAAEIDERRGAETRVREMNEQLEERVLLRTAQLTRSEASFRQLAETLPQMVWMAGAGGETEYSNRQWIDYSGIAPRAQESPGWRSLLHPSDAPAALERWRQSTHTGDPFDGEYRLRGKDGGYRWFLARSRAVVGEHGGILRWFGTFTDIDDQKRAAETLGNALADLRWEMKRRRDAEDQLLQAQKMEAIGRLAGGVAHDFNNLLTVILGYNEMLPELLREHPEGLEFAREVRRAAQRASDLTNQLLAFSRRQVFVPRVLNLNEVVRLIEKMLRRIIGEDVQLHLKLADAPPCVKVDPAHIDQVIMNLAVNSRDAMPNGGHLTLETAAVTWSSEYGDSHPGLQPGPYAMLAVSDTGSGMDELTRSRLFEPFFTTKEKGKGTGLGLSIVYGIVKQSGGDILVYSEPGQGTVFKIYLPATSEPAEQLARPSPAAGAAVPTETILLVEDEAQVRSLTRTMLLHLGYQVLDAGGGEDALKLLATHPQAVHLLLTDIVMPGLNGTELAGMVHSLRPAMKVLFMSGYTGGGLAGQGLLDPGTAFIPKPFTTAELGEKVREALGFG